MNDQREGELELVLGLEVEAGAVAQCSSPQGAGMRERGDDVLPRATRELIDSAAGMFAPTSGVGVTPRRLARGTESGVARTPSPREIGDVGMASWAFEQQRLAAGTDAGVRLRGLEVGERDGDVDDVFAFASGTGVHRTDGMANVVADAIVEDLADVSADDLGEELAAAIADFGTDGELGDLGEGVEAPGSGDVPGLSRKVSKPRVRSKRTRPRSKTIALKRLTRAELARGALEAPPVDDAVRPMTRAECVDGARPCPWVSCKHHLYLDINPRTGSIKINFPDLEPWEMQHTCALDVADSGALTLEEIGLITNLTRERVRQVEVRGLITLKTRSNQLR